MKFAVMGLWILFLVGDLVAYAASPFPQRRTEGWWLPGSGYVALYRDYRELQMRCAK